MSRRNPLHPQSGMTLVEVIVAATVLGVAFTGVSTLITAGRDAESAEFLRGQGLRVASNAMEDTLYTFPRYNSIAAGFFSRTDSLRTESGSGVAATVYTTVAPEDSVGFQDAYTGFTIIRKLPYKKLTCKVKWTYAGQTDSVMLVKRVCKLNP